MTTPVNICFYCAEYYGNGTCRAFSNGIPDSILISGSHDKPVKGDGGIVFKLKEELKDDTTNELF